MKKQLVQILARTQAQPDSVQELKVLLTQLIQPSRSGPDIRCYRDVEQSE